MNDTLYVLWTNDNPVTVEKMVFMYVHNAVKKGWWSNVTLIIWGATAELAVGNATVREKLKEMKKDGVHLTACEACADQLGVSEKLEAIGVELRYWGEPLTELIKEDAKLITL